MRGGRTAGAITLALAIAFSVPACSVLDVFEPPPLKAEFPPLPPEPPTSDMAQRVPPPPPIGTHAEMVSWLSGKGYRDFQVAAFVQLANTESGFRPCVVGPGGYHYLFQWGGTRLRQLRDFAQTSGCPQLHTQLAFTDKELRSEPSFSCFWGATSTPAAYVALRRIFGHGSC